MTIFPKNCRDELVYGVLLTEVGLYFKMYENFARISLWAGIVLLAYWAVRAGLDRVRGLLAGAAPELDLVPSRLELDDQVRCRWFRIRAPDSRGVRLAVAGLGR